MYIRISTCLEAFRKVRSYTFPHLRLRILHLRGWNNLNNTSQIAKSQIRLAVAFNEFNRILWLTDMRCHGISIYNKTHIWGWDSGKQHF